jgi:hypothetical protein
LFALLCDVQHQHASFPHSAVYKRPCTSPNVHVTHFRPRRIAPSPLRQCIQIHSLRHTIACILCCPLFALAAPVCVPRNPRTNRGPTRRRRHHIVSTTLSCAQRTPCLHSTPTPMHLLYRTSRQIGRRLRPLRRVAKKNTKRTKTNTNSLQTLPNQPSCQTRQHNTTCHTRKRVHYRLYHHRAPQNAPQNAPLNQFVVQSRLGGDEPPVVVRPSSFPISCTVTMSTASLHLLHNHTPLTVHHITPSQRSSTSTPSRNTLQRRSSVRPSSPPPPRQRASILPLLSSHLHRPVHDRRCRARASLPFAAHVRNSSTNGTSNHTLRRVGGGTDDDGARGSSVAARQTTPVFHYITLLVCTSVHTHKTHSCLLSTRRITAHSFIPIPCDSIQQHTANHESRDAPNSHTRTLSLQPTTVSL